MVSEKAGFLPFRECYNPHYGAFDAVGKEGSIPLDVLGQAQQASFNIGYTFARSRYELCARRVDYASIRKEMGQDHLCETHHCSTAS